MSYLATERPSHHFHDDDELNSSEEEEERLLSEEHGEAADDGPKRKRSKTNQTAYTEADAAAAKEFEEKVVRAKKPRPTLTPADLKGSKGLVLIRRSFPQVKFREGKRLPVGTGSKSSALAQKMNRQSQITAAANYTTSLMTSYRNFARTLFSSLAPEDVLLKIEDMGSKKEIKDYLQIMRNDVRKEYLEGIYGVEKTERILNELENGVTRPAVGEFNEGLSGRTRIGVLDEEIFGDGEEDQSRPREMTNVEDDLPKDAGTDVSDEEEELEFVAEEKLVDNKDVDNSIKLDDKNANMESTSNEADIEGSSPKVTNHNEVEKNQDVSVELDKDDLTEENPTEDATEDKNQSITNESEAALEMQEEDKPPNSNTLDGNSIKTVEESTLDQTKVAGLDDVAGEFVIASETKTAFAETQESLTLVASQFGDDDLVGETQDEAMDENKSANKDWSDPHEYTHDIESQPENSADERFSQSNGINSESKFEVEEQSQNHDEGVNDINLGQTQGEPSQFSMEY